MEISREFVTDNFENDIRIDIDKYIKFGGFKALKKTFSKGSKFVIDEIKMSMLQGRGGAGYPTWKKLEAAYNRQVDTKYLICNADEGEPGTFKDRDLLELDPFLVIEGMIITAFTIGSAEGYVYLREEYDYIQEKFIEAIDLATKNGYLGKNILDSGFDFTIKVHGGAGSYICGETTALVESMHGKTCRSRLKLPRVGTAGYNEKPTLVNNVETLAYITKIIDKGAKDYIKTGTEKSKGTKLISLCGNIEQLGVYEIPFGLTINEIIEKVGGGAKENREIKFLQAGGASGSIIPGDMFDLEYSYENFKRNGFQIGSGSLVIADDSVRIIDYLLATQRFFYHESCGKCTPCREGNKRLLEILEKICVGDGVLSDLDKMESISINMQRTSLCGLGQTAPNALLSVLKNYRDECVMYINKEDIDANSNK